MVEPNIRWSSDPAHVESLGQVKVRDLPSFLGRNISPASLVQRLFLWSKSWGDKFVFIPKVGMRPFWIMAIFVMAHQYTVRYNLSPIYKKHKWRKYH